MHNGDVITRGLSAFVDELRRQALLLNPSWPDPEERRGDLAAHVRLSGAFRRAASAGCR